jgi:AraC-like DNA-binding protein
MNPSFTHHLLDSFPLVRAHTTEEACREIGRAFSRHHLVVKDGAPELCARHNQVQLEGASLNVLSYGADVIIDPGERGDFYMVQMPLRGWGRLESPSQDIVVNPDVLSILQPRGQGRMHWSEDCEMVLLCAPSQLVHRRYLHDGAAPHGAFALSRSRQDPNVAAWWQAAMDITHNLDRFGSLWLSHRAACASMQEFLLSAFSLLFAQDDSPARADRGNDRCVRKAKEYIHAHLDRALTLCEIADHACVSARTLESAFRRHGEASPLSYAREQRLRAAHEALAHAHRSGQAVAVTEVALNYGFIHLGRFAAQYRKRFGCSPSDTLRPRGLSLSSPTTARALSCPCPELHEFFRRDHHRRRPQWPGCRRSPVRQRLARVRAGTPEHGRRRGQDDRVHPAGLSARPLCHEPELVRRLALSRRTRCAAGAARSELRPGRPALCLGLPEQQRHRLAGR